MAAKKRPSQVPRLKKKTSGSLEVAQPEPVGRTDEISNLKAVLASTLDPVVTIDTLGEILSASDSVERVFGWTPAELIGMNVRSLMPEPYRGSHDGYLARYRETGKTNILGRAREFEAVRKNGVRFPVEISVTRVKLPGSDEPRFVGILRDVSERKRAEQEVRLMQAITRGMSEAKTLDDAMRLTLREICEATGWGYGEVWLEGEEAGHLVGGVTWTGESLLFESLQRALAGVDIQTSTGLAGRIWGSSHEVWIPDIRLLSTREFVRRDAAIGAGVRAIAGIPIRCEDEPVAALLFMLREAREQDMRLLSLARAAVAPLGNVIRRKRAEDELEQHHNHLEGLVKDRTSELERTHEQLRLADRLAAIGTMAAGLGHDMHNVLLPVRCRLDALAVMDLPDAVKQELQAIRRSVTYLQQLSDGLHFLALDPEDAEASGGVTDLARWWEQVGVLLRKAVPKNATLVTEFAENLPPVEVAPHRLTQAVLNLVVNAGEAVPAAGGKVRAWAELLSDGRFVRIGIEDNGYGMTPEVKRRALDPFFTTKKRGLGTGLGLPLVRGVVQSAGGSMEIESEPGRGTRITLMIPAGERVRGGERAGGRAIAAVSIRDARASSFVSAFLQAGGMSVRKAGDTDPGPSLVWVTEPTKDAAGAAKRYLRENAKRRVVVFGPASAEWERLGAILVPQTDDFDRIRQGIGEAIAAVMEDDT